VSFWVAGAVLGSAAIGAIGSSAAAGTQASGQQQAAQTQWNMFNTINQQQQPFIQGGYGALNKLLYGLGINPVSMGGTAAGGGGSQPSVGVGTATSGTGTAVNPTGNPIIDSLQGRIDPISSQAIRPTSGMPTQAPGRTAAGVPGSATGGGDLSFGQLTSNFTPQDFLNNLDPGYQFQLQTGGQAIRNQDTPGVGALSGPALKDLMSFNQSMAATGYQNAYNRFQTTNQNIFSRLSGIAGLGQNAAANVGTQGTVLGTGIAGAQAGAAASQAGGIVGATNALGGSAVPLAYLMAGQGGGGTSSSIGNWTPGTPNPAVPF